MSGPLAETGVRLAEALARDPMLLRSLNLAIGVELNLAAIGRDKSRCDELLEAMRLLHAIERAGRTEAGGVKT